MRGGKIRILILSHTLGEGGLEEVVLTYARLLDKNKFDVTVAYMVGGRIARECESIPEVRLVHISTPSRVKRFFQLVRLLYKLQIDILHNHLSWYGVLAGVLAATQRVETIHNTYYWYTGIKRWAFALIGLFVHEFIAVSAVVKTFTLGFFPFMSENKFTVIYNGIDTHRFRPLHDRPEVRQKLGFSGKDFLVTFVGRLEEQKGLKYLLSAAQELGHLKFLIVGEGSLRESLQKSATEHSLANIVFLGHRNDIASLLGVSDCFVLPSLYEGLPLTLLQAMAVGCPAVVSRVGGVPEIIEDGVNGFLVDPGSTEQLCEKINLLFKDSVRRNQFSTLGRALVVRQFTDEVMVQKTERLYQQLMGLS